MVMLTGYPVMMVVMVPPMIEQVPATMLRWMRVDMEINCGI